MSVGSAKSVLLPADPDVIGRDPNPELLDIEPEAALMLRLGGRLQLAGDTVDGVDMADFDGVKAALDGQNSVGCSGCHGWSDWNSVTGLVVRSSSTPDFDIFCLEDFDHRLLVLCTREALPSARLLLCRLGANGAAWTVL